MKILGKLITIGILILSFSTIVLAEGELTRGYFTLKDDKGRIISRTGHVVVIGDEYLNSLNRLYRVIKVNGNTAIVKLVKNDGMKLSSLEQFRAFLAGVFSFDFFRGEVKQSGPIAIYHTHSDESYVPSEGTSSKAARGGIFQVGNVLANALEKKGIPVIHSKASHDPHDSMSYDRSRRTAAQLLRQRPTTLIDVHRDAGPSTEYSKMVNNKWVTKIQLVVGRQNPNFQANNDFAKRLKAEVDRRHPGLIKGIFYGKGKFNQDLGPQTILLEFGTEKNSQEAAERGANLFAAAASDVLYGAAGMGAANRGSLKSLFWIIAIVIGGAGIFLLINRKSLKGIGKEFTSAVGEEDSEMQKDNHENKHSDQNGEPS